MSVHELRQYVGLSTRSFFCLYLSMRASFALFAVRLGEPMVMLGTAFNSIVLASVTVMTEQRMLSRWPPERAALYREYMRSTSPCVPWFRRST